MPYYCPTCLAPVRHVATAWHCAGCAAVWPADEVAQLLTARERDHWRYLQWRADQGAFSSPDDIASGDAPDA